jgi:hypothetical protein
VGWCFGGRKSSFTCPPGILLNNKDFVIHRAGRSFALKSGRKKSHQSSKTLNPTNYFVDFGGLVFWWQEKLY